MAFFLSLIAHFLAYYEIVTDSSAPQYSFTAPSSCTFFIFSWYWFYTLCVPYVSSYSFLSFTTASLLSFSITLLFSLALIVTAHTDVQTFLISRRYTLFLIPIGWIAAFFHLSSISFLNSVTGTLLGFLLLHFINFIGKKRTKAPVLGEGDKELLAFIGSFAGISGCWFSLLYGSYIGSIVGIIGIFILKKKTSSFKIPFGAFLAVGALLYLAFHCAHVTITPKNNSLLLVSKQNNVLW